MSRKTTIDIDIALPQVDPKVLYEEVDLADQPILAGPVSNDLKRALRGIGNVASWAKANLKRSIVVFISILVVTDLVGRVAEPRLVNRVYDEMTTAGYAISRNQEGYRGPLVQAERVQDEFRILALGDSVTFGTGLPFESSWPMVLSGQLEAENNLEVEAINLSGPAADLTQLADLLRRYGESHKPDVAVLVLTGNMVSLAWIRDGATRRRLLEPPSNRTVPWTGRIKASATRFQHSFAVPGILIFGMERYRLATGLSDHLIDPNAPYGVMLAQGIRQNTLPPETAEAAWSIFRRQLGMIQRVARDVHVPLLVTYSPPRFLLSDRFADNTKFVPTERFTIDPFKRSASICGELDIPFVRIDDSLRAASEGDENLYIIGDYSHFDRAGHRLVAAVLNTEISKIIIRRALTN
jgi:lysophospholipase L1-like esterase